MQHDYRYMTGRLLNDALPSGQSTQVNSTSTRGSVAYCCMFRPCGARGPLRTREKARWQDGSRSVLAAIREATKETKTKRPHLSWRLTAHVEVADPGDGPDLQFRWVKRCIDTEGGAAG